jgi:homoserine dehydrogenase
LGSARSAAARSTCWYATPEIARRAGRGSHHPCGARATGVSIGVGSTGIDVGRRRLRGGRRPDIDIVVELIGGYEPARELVLRAIANGKHVVTANKALIALHGNEIFAAAQAQGVMVAFEAAVAGGIPIIKALREGLAANRIEWIAGIINGTGNFILTEMRDKGRAFADVLAEAQALGYAEADPDLRRRGHRRGAQADHPRLDRVRHPAAVRSLYTEGISAYEPRTSPTPRSSATASSTSASPPHRRRGSSCACTRP